MKAAGRTRAPVVLVTGGKGGVGKSTLVANLGVTLARHGLRVLLADLDLSLANLHVLLGVAPRHSLVDFFAGRPLAGCVAEGPAGVGLLPAGNGASELSRADGTRVDRLAEALAGLPGYDLVLADSAAGIGPDVLGFAARADHVLLVTTPDPAALTDAFGLVKALDGEGSAARELATPELFLNEVGGADQADRLAARMRGVCERFLARSPRLAGWLPRSSAVRRAARDQRPFVLTAPRSLEAGCLEGLSRRLEGRFGLRRPGIAFSSSMGS